MKQEPRTLEPRKSPPHEDQRRADRRPYEKPEVTKHGNLKKITALSFTPPG